MAGGARAFSGLKDAAIVGVEAERIWKLMKLWLRLVRGKGLKKVLEVEIERINREEDR